MARFRVLPPALVDGVLITVCVTAMLLDLLWTDGLDFSLLAVVTIVAGALPIALRRPTPIGAYLLAMVLVPGILDGAGIYNAVAFPAMVCGYTLCDRRGRQAALIACPLTMLATVVILQVYSPHPLIGWDTAKNLGLVALPMALGVAAHDRRSYTTALVERAEAAERNRETETRRRIGAERLRIARDVHDVVAHAMVAINVQAGVGAHLLDRDPDQARATLRDIKRVSGEALNDLRSMLGVLRDDAAPESAALYPTQGLDEIDDLREGLGSAGITLDVDIDPSATPLPASVGATGYRIVQEALTNVMRHAGPTCARVRVTRSDGRVLIEVEDDGGTAPAPLDRSGSGNGLRGMSERANAVGGSLEAGPRDEGGWRVSASLPVGAP